jgi:hypothetical protein
VWSACRMALGPTASQRWTSSTVLLYTFVRSFMRESHQVSRQAGRLRTMLKRCRAFRRSAHSWLMERFPTAFVGSRREDSGHGPYPAFHYAHIGLVHQHGTFPRSLRLAGGTPSSPVSLHPFGDLASFFWPHAVPAAAPRFHTAACRKPPTLQIFLQFHKCGDGHPNSLPSGIQLLQHSFDIQNSLPINPRAHTLFCQYLFLCAYLSILTGFSKTFSGLFCG